MVKQTKVYEVEDLKAKINDSKGFFLFDYQGWGANLFNQLRQKVAGEGGQLKVIRNNLFGRAIEDIVPDEKVDGPTACLFSLDDEVAPLASLCGLLKENNLEPNVKLGFLAENKQILDSQESLHLASLPGTDTLRAMLVGGLVANLGRLVSSLNAPISNFALVVKSLSEQQGGDK